MKKQVALKAQKNQKASKNGKPAKAQKVQIDRQYFVAAGFTVIAPTAGARILLANYVQATGVGNITVRVMRIGAGFNTIFCRVDAASGAAMPLAPDGTLTQLNQVGGTEEFRSDVVPVTVPMNQAPAAPGMTIPGSRYLRIASYDNANALIEEDEVVICPIPPVIVTTVTSRACLWLAFADDGIVLPGFGENPAGGFRPTGLVVPSGCNLISLTVENNGPWQHHPTNDRRSGAEGLPGDANKTALQRPDIYKSGDAALKSDNIDGSEALPLNALVGLADRGWNVASRELLIGTAASFTFSDPQPVKFHLGFHDGFQWSNNDDGAGAFGQVQVRVEWGTSTVT